MQQKKIIIHQDVYISVILVALGVFLYTQTNKMIHAAARFPRIMIIAFLFFMAVALVHGVQKSIKATQEQNPESARLLKWAQNKMPYALYTITLIYVLLLKPIGFFPATAIFVPAVMLFFNNRQWIRILLVTVGTLVFVYLVFIKLLYTNLP